MNTTLASIAQLLRDKGLLVRTQNLDATTGATPVSGCDCDNRVPNAGHVFVCKGHAFKAAYLVSAINRGAVAYLCDESRAEEYAEAAPSTPAFVVSDIRRAMAHVSAVAFGHPDRAIGMVGITGTKGKSTVAYMMRAVLDGEDAYSHAAIMGSIETYDGIEREESHNTTPEAPDLWRHLANARDAGLTHMVMEVSSQGLKYDRVLDLEFDGACFLNIGRDHISPVEHHNFEDYFESKLRIFDQAKTAVVNLDCDQADVVLARAQRCERVITFSAKDHTADVWAEDINPSYGLVRFTAHTPTWEGYVVIPMPGIFNVDNALATIAMAEALGIEQEQIVNRFYLVRVPGRMELLMTPDRRVTGIVDYAHNKLSYQRFFPSMKEEFPGYAIIALFGAPGEKAQERRTELPQEAARWADYLIYTEEDPANEPVEKICAEMAAATPEGTPYEVICDREKAVFRAVELAYSLDTPALVCLLAKGDETRQHEGDLFVPCRPDGDIFADAVRLYHTPAQDD